MHMYKNFKISKILKIKLYKLTYVYKNLTVKTQFCLTIF